MALMLLDNNNSGGFRTTGTNGRFAASAPPTSVVSNGLVLYLDAGKAASYPGSGTTWNDLSGNGNHGTLFNSPTFASTTNGGELIFNGSNQYGTTPTTNFPFESNQFGGYGGQPKPTTISVWAKASVASGMRQVFAYGGWAGSQAKAVGQLGGTLRASFSSVVLGESLNTGISTPLNTWFHLTFVYTAAGQIILYVNGSSVVVSNDWVLNSRSLVTAAGIARGVTNSPSGDKEYWQGSIGSILVYNRALSAAEILQNYSLQWGTT